MRTLGASSQEGWQVPLALTFRTEFFRNLLGKKDALVSDCQFESELPKLWSPKLTKPQFSNC